MRRLLDGVAGAGSSPLDRARTAASSPRNDVVKNCRVHARGRVSLPSGAAQTSAADAMMIKCDDIVRERDIASVCAIEFVQTGLFYACLAGRLDKYDALSVFFGLR